MRQPDSLEQVLGISFKNGELLRLALVHSSYLNETPEELPESNERLEFLGDGVLGLVVAHELYERHPDRPEGELTAMRSKLVRGETLARIAEKLELGRYLVLGKGEEASGGRQRPSNLAAAFEALVGALLLDQGYEAAEAFVLGALADELSAVDRPTVPKSPKSLLQEVVQGRGLAAPTYRLLEATGQEHERRFTSEVVIADKPIGRGSGRRKSEAEQQAAREALKSLDVDE